MSKDRSINDLRARLHNRLKAEGETVFYATVQSVDTNARTCTVESNGATYDDVLLYAVADKELKGWVVVPKEKSMVLVGRIGGSNELYVAMTSEVDAVVLTVGDKVEVVVDKEGLALKADTTTLNATNKGVTLTKGAAGLKKTIADLCDALTKLTVTTGVGPSGVPINAADFMQIKQELNDYLEG